MSHLPRHLLEPEVVESGRAAEWLRHTGDQIKDTISPLTVIGARAMEADFVEWRGEGAYLCTPEGEKILDCLGAGGIFGLGFAHPDIVEAVTLQARRGGLGSRAGFIPGQAELAELLLGITPASLTKVAFGNSGTEGVEMAIKLARLTTGRRKLIGTHMGYHGMSIGTISISGLNMWREGIAPYLESTALVTHGDLESLDDELDEDTAAVVLEPIQWASGCRVPPPDYFQAVSRMCKERGALLILDEVQTGLGRAGYRFALEHLGIEPDLLVVGKILSGGMVPISAVLFNERVHSAERDRAVFNNSSYAGNPLACAAGIATLNLLQDRYFERARLLGEQMGLGFQALLEEFSETLLVDYHGLGLMRCLEFDQPMLGVVFADKMRSQENTIVAAMAHIPQFVRISPPFIISDQDMADLLQACRRVLQEMSQTPTSKLTHDVMVKISRVQEGMSLERPVGDPG